MKIKPFKITSEDNTLRGIMLNCDAKKPKRQSFYATDLQAIC